MNSIHDEVIKLVMARDYEKAEQMLNEALYLNPFAHEAWASLAYVYSHQDNHLNAIDAIDRAIRLIEEPAYYYQRSRYKAMRHDYEGVLADCTRVLELCTLSGSDYYRSAAQFRRTIALYKLCRYNEAYEASLKVDKGEQQWLDGLQTIDRIKRMIQKAKAGE